MPTVYGVPLSPFVRKVRLALTEKGIDYDLEPVMPMPPHNETPDFRAISPLGKIPAYREGDFAISDSSVILNYLDRKHTNPSLTPSSPEDGARALWFEELADSKLAESVGPIFFNRIVKPNMLGQEPDPAAIAAGQEAVRPHFDYVESKLGANGMLVGSALSVADIAMGAILRLYEIAGETVDNSTWPKLAAYHQRLNERPAFSQTFESEDNFISQMAS